MKRTTFFIALVLPFSVISCTSTRTTKSLEPTPPAIGVVAENTVFVATTREPSGDTGTLFSGERSRAMSFAKLEVSVPPKHRFGRIEVPKRSRKPDPRRHFSVSQAAVEGERQFRSGLADAIRRSGNGEVGIFVHGYKTHFDRAVFYLSQMAHDAGYEGVPLLFTWPSRGRLLEYAYDLDSALASRDGLVRTVRIAKEAGAKKVYILAHSMGSMLTMEAVRQAALEGDATFGGVLGGVGLAAPDISMDTFRSQLRHIEGVPITALISRDDMALDLSKWLAGGIERVGSTRDSSELTELGITVIDLTAVKANKLAAHSKFAESPSLITHAFDQLERDRSLPDSGLGELTLPIAKVRDSASAVYRRRFGALKKSGKRGE